MKTTHTHKQFFLVALFTLFATVSNVCKGQIDCGQKYAIENVLICPIQVTYTITCNSVHAPVTVIIPSTSTYYVPSCGGTNCDISVQLDWVQSLGAYPQTNIIVNAGNPTSGYTNNPTLCSGSTGFGYISWSNYVTQISY